MAIFTEEKLSLTKMSQLFKEDGITRNMVLEYLVNTLGYVKDAKEITELGLKSGVSYMTSEENPSVKWPVYGPDVQELLSKHIEEIKALKPADVPKIRKKRLEPGQPEKVPEDEMPELEELTSLQSNSYVVYDFETTGLRADRDAIIEIGAVRVTNGIIMEDFQELVKPYKKGVNDLVTMHNGITKEMVQDARPIWEVMKDFMTFVGDDVMVGFNSAQFDSKFLKRAGRVSGIKIYNKQFDVMTYAVKNADRLGLPQCKRGRVSLAALSDFYGIINPEAHRALADAITTAKIFFAMK